MATATQRRSAERQIGMMWRRAPISPAQKVDSAVSILQANNITDSSEARSVLDGAGVPEQYWTEIINRAMEARPITTPPREVRPTTTLKVYTDFGGEDIVENMSRRTTTGMWTGDTGSLIQFYRSTAQSSSTGDWYYDIYNLDPNISASAEVQFAVAYGHQNGGGAPRISVLDTSKEPTKAIYSQYRNMLLDPEDETFTFANSWDSDQIFVINLQRARLKQKMDAGNWELRLQASLANNSTVIRLIDDSAQKFDQAVSQGGRLFNVVSGSLNVGATATVYKDAASEASGGYGLFYPDRGLIILNPNALEAHMGSFVSTGSASTTLADNHFKLYEMIKSASYFTARNEEVITSTNYFVRIKNKDYNLSNNPTYYTSSDGTLKVPTFIGDPHSYITTVGLYNESNELLAVAKVSVPLLKSFDREALIKVKLDY